MNKINIKLSSNVTFVYKYLIPIMFFSVFLVLIISLFVNILGIELGARIVLTFISFLFCLFMLPLLKLNFISYNEAYTLIKSYKQTKKVPNKNVIKVKRFMFYFYRLFYTEKNEIKKALFLPHIIGVFIRFWGKPKSIKKYEINIG